MTTSVVVDHCYRALVAMPPTDAPRDCLVALGANLGDRERTIAHAGELLAKLPNTELIATSALLANPPVGGPADQGEFLNGCARLRSTLPAHELAEQLVAIEHRCGRQRHERWSARTLDLDLLLVGDDIVDTPQLTLPHPRMAVRSFVLGPASEIAGELSHPWLRGTLGELYHVLWHGRNEVLLVGEPAAIESLRPVWQPLLAPPEHRITESAEVTAQCAAVPGVAITGRDGGCELPRLAIVCGPLAARRHAPPGVPALLVDPQSPDAAADLSAAVTGLWPHLGGPVGSR